MFSDLEPHIEQPRLKKPHMLASALGTETEQVILSHGRGEPLYRVKQGEQPRALFGVVSLAH
jgi:hypothetical protein